MTKIAITADSTCDMPVELQDKYNIKIIPLHVTVGNKTYSDCIDIEARDLFSYYDRTQNLPKSSAPSPADYISVFQKLTDEGYEILHFALSSKISSSYSNALFVSKDFPNVHVIDTLNICGSSTLLAIEAAEMAAAGVEIEDIIREIEKDILLASTSFVVDTMEYLYKGGRCSSLAVMINNVLDIKPCIEMKDGAFSVAKAYRKLPKKLISQYIDDTLKKRKSASNKRIFIAETFYDDSLAEYAYSILKDKYGFEEIITNKAGCIISKNCGPNTIGLFFIDKD